MRKKWYFALEISIGKKNIRFPNELKRRSECYKKTEKENEEIYVLDMEWNGVLNSILNT